MKMITYVLNTQVTTNKTSTVINKKKTCEVLTFCKVKDYQTILTL